MQNYNFFFIRQNFFILFLSTIIGEKDFYFADSKNLRIFVVRNFMQIN